MTDSTLFQCVQKIVLFRKNDREVLLAKRAGEADYDDMYSFIGGKIETTDGGLLQGMKREKDEEIGADVKVSVCPQYSFNAYFVKSNNQHVILPHYYAHYESGDIKLSDEYSDYKWVKVSELNHFEPKIGNITEITKELLELKKFLKKDQFARI